MYAYITPPTKYEKPPKFTSLEIDGYGVSFFIAPLRQYCTFVQHENDPDRWELLFFAKTPFKTQLSVHLATERKTIEKRLGTGIKARAAYYVTGYEGSEPARHEEDMSQFLRGSAALTCDSLMLTAPGRHLINDRDGLAYFSQSEHQFKRVVLCQALAIAYGQVLNKCVSQLTNALKKKEYGDLPELYEKILFFNASDYFSHPIHLDRHELFTVWQMISRHWHLNEFSQELTDQLAGVAQLLKERRDKKAEQLHRQEAERIRRQEKSEENRLRQEAEKRHQQEKHEQQLQEAADKRLRTRGSRINIMIGLMSLLLTTLSVVTVVELRPADFQQAYESWYQFFTH